MMAFLLNDYGLKEDAEALGVARDKNITESAEEKIELTDELLIWM